MASYNYGKAEVCAWIRENFRPASMILDVGAGDGKWRRLLPEYPYMEAAEAYMPNADRLTGYSRVHRAEIQYMEYLWYDLIIFGDVIEHMTPQDAQAVLGYAWPRCRDLIVAVPFRYEQGALDGNPYERHIQDDLTPEIVAERYPALAVLHDPGHGYMYYHKGDAGA